MNDDDLDKMSMPELIAYRDRHAAVVQSAQAPPQPDAAPPPQSEEPDLDKMPMADLIRYRDEHAAKRQQAQEQLLAPHREQVTREANDLAQSGSTWGGKANPEQNYWLRAAVGGVRAPIAAWVYADAKSKLNSGEADAGDLRNIALYEQEQGYDQAQSGAKKWAGTAMSAPSNVAVAMVPGLREAAFGGSAIAGAALAGGSAPTDLSSLLKGGAEAGTKVYLLHKLGPLADKVFPGAQGVLAKTGAAAVTGTAGMALTDYAAKVAGLSDQGGAIQDLIEGRLGDAGRNAVGNFLMTGAVGLQAELNRGAPPKVAVQKAVEAVQAQAEQAAIEKPSGEATPQTPPPAQPGEGPAAPATPPVAPGSMETAPTPQPVPEAAKPAPSPPAAQPPGPFEHLPPEDFAALADALGIKKAKTPEALAAELGKKGMKPDAIQALSDASKPARQKTAAPDTAARQRDTATPPEFPEGSAAEAAGSPERRVDLARRKAVEEMTPGEKDQAIAELRRQAESRETDAVTGFKDARSGTTRDDATRAAIESGRPGVYAEMDLANLGGLNAHAGNSGANTHFRAVADIIRSELSGLGDVELMRHGGDELSAVVAGADQPTVDAALGRARARVAEYARQQGLADIPHPKYKGDESKKGIGVHFGTADVRPGDKPADVYQRADRLLERRKITREYGEPAAAAGAAPLEGRPGGAGEGPGRPGGEAGAGERGARAAAGQAPEEAGPAGPPVRPDLPHVSTTDTPSLLNRLDRPDSGLTAEQTYILQSRLNKADPKSFRVLGKELGVSYTEAMGREREALRTLGYDGTVAQLHAVERDRAVESGQKLPADDLHLADPENVHGNRRIEELADVDAKLDRLLKRKALLRRTGKLTPEKEAEIHGEYERLKQIADAGQSEAGAAQGQQGGGGEATQRPAEQPPPVRRAGGEPVPGGAPATPAAEQVPGPPAAAHPGGPPADAGGDKAPGHELGPRPERWVGRGTKFRRTTGNPELPAEFTAKDGATYRIFRRPPDADGTVHLGVVKGADQLVANASFFRHPDGTYEPVQVGTHATFQRRGLATAMYDYVASQLGPLAPAPGEHQTPEGASLWRTPADGPPAGGNKAPGNKLSPFHRGWEAKAKEAGVEPADLHGLAKQHIQQNREQLGQDAGKNALIDYAYDRLKKAGVTPQTIAAMRRKGLDAADPKLRGARFDEIAQDAGDNWPSFFDADRENPVDTLLNILKDGKTKELSPTDAYQHALDELTDQKEAARVKAEAKRQGHPDGAVEEALRSGKEDGAADGTGAEGDAAGGDFDDAFGGAGDFDPAEFGAPLAESERRQFLGGGQPDAGGRRLRETALANAKIDQERSVSGLPPVLSEARKTNPEIWDRAMAALDADPDAARKLVADLAAKPRATTAEENALILQRKVAVDNEYRRVVAQYSEALRPENRAARDAFDFDALERREEALAAERDRVHTVARRTGTEWGRAGQFRRQLALEDFSLGSMLNQAAAAKGEPLTREERLQITQLQTKIAELQAKLDAAEKSYDMAEAKPGSKAWGEMNTARVRAGRAQAEFTDQLGDYRSARRPVSQKVFDALLAWQRFSLLSGVKTLGKIASASAETFAVNPAKEVAGQFWGWIPGIARIAAKANVEGGLSGKAEGSALASIFQGIKDGIQKATTGRSDLDVLYGKDARSRGGVQRVLEFPQDVHAALKAPALRAAYERTFTKLLAAEDAAGRDATSPAAVMRAGAQAYQEAHRAIFMEDNKVVDAVNRAIGSLRNPENSFGAQALGAGLKTLLPIVKVPTNVVAQSFEAAFGVVPGLTRAMLVPFRGGMAELKPEQADLVMRQLKAGSVGGAMFVLGAMNPKMFGGFYTNPNDEKKRKAAGDVPTGGVRVGGVTLPAWTQHNPVLVAGQMGASFRRTLDKTFRGQQESALDAFAGSVVGLGKETPLLEEPARLAEALGTPGGRARFLGQYLSGLSVPRAVKELSRVLDPVEKRKAEGTGQVIQQDVPVLRQRLPVGR